MSRAQALAEISPFEETITTTETGTVQALGVTAVNDGLFEIKGISESSETRAHPAGRVVPSGEELREKVITSAHLPDLKDSADPTVIEIIDDKIIRIGSSELTFKNDRAFFFNALLLLRDKPRAMSDYVRLVPSEEQNDGYNLPFSKRLLRAVESINEAAGKDLIYKIGNKASTQYLVDPVTLVDRRSQPPNFESTQIFSEVSVIKTAPQTKIQHPKPPIARGREFGLPVSPIEGFERAEFKALEERSNVFLEILNKYKGRPRVNELLRYVIKPDAEVSANSSSNEKNPLQMLPKYRSLKQFEVNLLFKHVEKGLSVYQDLEGNSPTANEEDALTELAAAHAVIFNCNLGLAIRHTRRFGYKPNDPAFADLLQYAFIGLDSGIKRYQYWQGNSLSTYVNSWIIQALGRGYSQLMRTIKLPINKDQEWSSYKKALNRLGQELQREPTQDEKVRYIGLTSDEIAELENQGPMTVGSLNIPLGADSSGKVTELIDTVPYYDEKDRSPDPAHRPALHPEIESMFEAANLSPKSQLVLSLKYGVYIPTFDQEKLGHNGNSFTYGELMEALHASGRELSYDDVASILNMKEESVITRIRKSITKLEKSDEVQKMRSVA